MKVFCVFGFKDIQKNGKFERVTQWDYAKIGRAIRGQWPKPVGERIDFETCDVPAWVADNPYEDK